MNDHPAQGVFPTGVAILERRQSLLLTRVELTRRFVAIMREERAASLRVLNLLPRPAPPRGVIS